MTPFDSTFQSAHFIKSAEKLSQCPLDQGGEVAFAGRSNAGKSTALNTLTNQKKLARTSKTPGRTQLINCFGLNVDDRRLIDLPGYGFAKVPIAMKKVWQAHMQDYLMNRRVQQSLPNWLCRRLSKILVLMVLFRLSLP